MSWRIQAYWFTLNRKVGKSTPSATNSSAKAANSPTSPARRSRALLGSGVAAAEELVAYGADAVYVFDDESLSHSIPSLTSRIWSRRLRSGCSRCSAQTSPAKRSPQWLPTALDAGLDIQLHGPRVAGRRDSAAGAASFHGQLPRPGGPAQSVPAMVTVRYRARGSSRERRLPQGRSHQEGREEGRHPQGAKAQPKRSIAAADVVARGWSRPEEGRRLRHGQAARRCSAWSRGRNPSAC